MVNQRSTPFPLLRSHTYSSHILYSFTSFSARAKSRFSNFWAVVWIWECEKWTLRGWLPISWRFYRGRVMIFGLLPTFYMWCRTENRILYHNFVDYTCLLYMYCTSLPLYRCSLVFNTPLLVIQSVTPCIWACARENRPNWSHEKKLLALICLKFAGYTQFKTLNNIG